MRLDELIAFNDELLALSRARLPVGQALLRSGGDLPGELGRLTTRLGTRLENGETLSTALKGEPRVPQLYAGVLAAGERAGNLTLVTERMAGALRRLRELRNAISLAFLYPLFIGILAISLAIVFVPFNLRPLADAFHFHRIDRSDWLTTWMQIYIDYGTWLIAVPIGLVIFIFFWQWQRNRAALVDGPPAFRTFAWIPGVTGILRNAQLATFTEVLAILIEQDVPVEQALYLAAEATEGKALASDAHRLRDHLQSGMKKVWKSQQSRGISPLIAWVLQTPLVNDRLAESLHRITRVHAERVRTQSHWLRFLLPTVATLSLAVVASLVFLSAYIVPWATFLYRLAMEA